MTIGDGEKNDSLAEENTDKMMTVISSFSTCLQKVNRQFFPSAVGWSYCWSTRNLGVSSLIQTAISLRFAFGLHVVLTYDC
jgi:hypothetical protein